MRISFFTPLPPAKTGIATYAAYLLPALARRAEVTVVVDQKEWESPEGCRVVHRERYAGDPAGALIYQLGNNPYHEWIYREAMERPGIVELHDVVLHHLIVEMTLARGRDEEYAAVLRENHGAPGEAWARGRIAGYHDEIGNFLFPASRTIADRSKRVIVHNRHAAEVLRRAGVSTAITVLDMPFPHPGAVEPQTHHGVVIGMFGFVTDAKRPQAVFEAFAEAHRRDPRLHLLVVGEAAPNLDLSELAGRFAIPADAWDATGYVSEEDFDRHLARVDRVVNLRYPSAGETSGALLRILHARQLVAVSDFGPFSDLPPAVAARIPLGREEHDSLVDFMLFGAAHDSDAQRRWIAQHSDLDSAVEAYLALAASPETGQPGASSSHRLPMPLFPALRLEEARVDGGTLELRLVNEGSEVVSSAQFGAPGYRLIVKLFDRAEEVFAQWISLESDLEPRGEATVRIQAGAAVGELRLYHAMQGVPDIDARPFATARLGA
jgi:glycosyltransferase involved in cell wall biosynthesis